MDILVNITLYMSCQAGPGIEPGPSALKASALPIELTWQTKGYFSTQEQQGRWHIRHTGGETKEPGTQRTQVVAHNA